LGKLCGLFGVTRQAYYEAEKLDEKNSIADMIILTLVKEWRASMPLIGGRKLMFKLRPQPEEHGIKMGRDQLFDLLRFHGLLVRRRKRTVRTTDSHHWLKKYPNLIQDMLVTAPEQLWVSDITYIRNLEGFSYLSLITDAYSRKIVGHCLYPTLEAEGCIAALQMALEGRRNDSPFVLVHHSDRGIQYCSSDYIELLISANIAISMTQSGSPYENALAERVNGIIKSEFFPKRIYQNHREAKKAIQKIIWIYNEQRPHASLDYLTPSQAEGTNGDMKRRWKRYSKCRKIEQLSEAI
jgi:transposase InsO family protein